MTVQLLLFYVLAAITVASGVLVVSARNPVHSVLFLILAFFNTAGLFVLIGAEFLAMVLVVVYVGAVAVLFMFVVMMLDVNFVRLRQGILQYLPVGLVVGLILLAELILVGGSWAVGGGEPGGGDVGGRVAAQPTPPMTEVTNTEALGRLLYTDYVFLFQAAGAILLVAIIGAITLTLRQRVDVRRQDIGRQVHRVPAESVELRKVRSGSGI